MVKTDKIEKSCWGCDDAENPLKICCECRHSFCEDCQSEHIEESHFNFDDWYDQNGSDYWV